MHSIFLRYLFFWKPLVYPIIGLGMIIEGDVILFTSAFLTHERFLYLPKVLVAVITGLFIGDILWYQLGIILRETKSLATIRSWIEHITKRFDKHLIERTEQTLFISKLMYGLGHLMIVRAGLLNMKKKEFLKKDFLASLIWMILVGSLGYFSSAWFDLIRYYLRFTEIALLLGLVGFLLLEFLISRLSDFFE